FIDAALNMPPELSVQLVEKAKKWAQSKYQLGLPRKLGALISHLSKGGQVEAALELTRVVLEIQPTQKKSATTKKEENYFVSPQPKARFDTWDYEEILKKNIPELFQAAGLKAFHLLCDLLDKAIRYSLSHSDSENTDDGSYIWRPAVEDHPQNRSHGGLKDILVTAVRDGAESLIQNNSASTRDIVHALERRPWPIFHRIALYLLKRFPDTAPDLVVERLADKKLFEDHRVQHEFSLLQETCFHRLNPGEQKKIFNWIESGPDIERFNKTKKELTDKKPSVQETVRYREKWQRDHLWRIKNHLPEDWRHRYQELVEKHGESKHPEFPVFTMGWVGPKSPKSAEELRAMGVVDMVEFLREWEPSDDHFAPSPEGLAREIASVIRQDPVRFAKKATVFKGLNPTYVHALMSGLRDALKEMRNFEWGPVLELCRWVIDQPREISGHENKLFDADPDWIPTRNVIAELLSTGFEKNMISIQLRDASWSILQPLTGYGVYDGYPTLDPPTIAINTVRGKALSAVIKYALWLRRNLKESQKLGKLVPSGFDNMPEVQEVLDAHLDVSKDPSLAIRSVYGRWFPWLVLLDPKWVKSRLEKIFPQNASEQAFHDAAWETYVLYNLPYDNVFEILHPYYKSAVGRLGLPKEKTCQMADVDEHLADHLMTFYWRGRIALKDPEGILQLFWNKASDALRGHAISFVGRSLRETKEPIDPEILQRIKTLWETRLNAAKSSARPENYVEELAAFGWWFISGKFDNHWAIEQLYESLKISGKTDPDFMVVEHLVALAKDMPYETVQCLEAIIKGDEEGWSIYGWKDEAKTILNTALQNPTAKETAENVINHLGSRGYFEFMELLKQK
ncbi:MAG: hypothetical protein JRI83_10760, partial [Deltaproteobacteria bacterium]|nr:hypothetical protein [Deltaproteobacteria bacterium]